MKAITITTFVNGSIVDQFMYPISSPIEDATTRKKSKEQFQKILREKASKRDFEKYKNEYSFTGKNGFSMEMYRPTVIEDIRFYNRNLEDELDTHIDTEVLHIRTGYSSGLNKWSIKTPKGNYLYEDEEMRDADVARIKSFFTVKLKEY